LKISVCWPSYVLGNAAKFEFERLGITLKNLVFPQIPEPPPKPFGQSSTKKTRQQSSFAEQAVTNEFLTEALAKQTEVIKSWLNPIIQNLIEKVVEQDNRIDDIESWVVNIEERMDKMEKNGAIDSGQVNNDLVTKLQNEIKDQAKELSELKQKYPTPDWLTDIQRSYQRTEDERRAKNLVIHGLVREKTSTTRHAERFFEHKLGITPPFERASWAGATGPLIVTLYRVEDS